MKRTALIAMILIIALSTVAFAEEMVKEFTVSNHTIAADKNGNDYCRFITQEEKTLGDVKYTVGVAVMTFSTSNPLAYEAVSALKDGDKVKLVVQSRQYQGRTSYTTLAVVQ